MTSSLATTMRGDDQRNGGRGSSFTSWNATLLHCISVLYKCYVFLLHYITALFVSLFFVVFFGRARLQNHFSIL